MFSYAVTGNCDGTATIDWDMGLSLEDALSQTNALDVSSCFNVAAAGAKPMNFTFRVRSVSQNGKYFPFRGNGDFKNHRMEPGGGWRRCAFTFEADDGKPFVPSALYAHDGCLEVYFDGFGDARSQGTKGYDLNDSRYDFLGNDVHRFLAVNWQLAQGTASATDAEVRERLVRKFTRTEKGYVYEIAFAARYMAPVDLKPGTVAGVGLCLHDYNRARGGSSGKGAFTHANLSNATAPGVDCDRKPYVWPLMILGN